MQTARAIKYVVIEHPSFPGVEVPLLLPENLEHKFAERIGRPISAGFAAITSRGCYVAGTSESLGIGVREDKDATLLREWFTTLPKPT